MRFQLEQKDKSIDSIINATFPNYKGRTIHVSTEIPEKLSSFMRGGTFSKYKFYELDGGEVLDGEQFLDRYNQIDAPIENMPPGCVLVEHEHFCGSDMGIIIYTNAEDIKVLPLPRYPQLSIPEEIVLRYTKSYLNTCGKEKNLRYTQAHKDTGITEKEWTTAQESLVDQKFLTKKGAIKPRGKNYLNINGSYEQTSEFIKTHKLR